MYNFRPYRLQQYYINPLFCIEEASKQKWSLIGAIPVEFSFSHIALVGD